MTVVCPSFVKTGMFEGVKPPFATPWLTTEQMTKKIYLGCLKEKTYVREPLMVKFIPFLKGISPVRTMDKVGASLGMDKAADTWKGRKDQDKFVK
jgi:hypothetical protein